MGVEVAGEAELEKGFPPRRRRHRGTDHRRVRRPGEVTLDGLAEPGIGGDGVAGKEARMTMVALAS